MNEKYVEELRKQYNVAISNGLYLKAKMIERRMQGLERRDD